MSALSTVDILRTAWALIDTPEKWTQKGVDALDARGAPVDSISPRAVCFCSSGAIRRAADDSCIGSSRSIALRTFSASIPYDNIPAWNDSPLTTHDDVRAAFAAAIQRAEATS